MTSQDFIGSWRRILTPSLGAANASQLYLIQGAEAFNRGDRGLLPGRPARQGQPHPGGLAGASRPRGSSRVLSGPAWMPVPWPRLRSTAACAARGNPWAEPGRWVGNGPFTLASWRRGQEIVVARSPTYWDAGRVALREIHFHTFDSIDAEERAFRAGQLHVTETIPPGKIDAYARESPGFLRADPLLGTFFLRVNVRRPVLNDARVRMALALAIDRAAIAEKILKGGQKPAASFTPPGLEGYAPEPLQQLQLEEARRLLAQSGHPGGAGLPAFDLLYNTSESHRTVAEAVQEMWRRDIGVQVRLVNEDFKSTEGARSTGTYDLLRSAWIADYADPSAFLEIWRGDSSNNFTGWSNPDYDSLLFAADRTADRASRDALYAKAERHPAERGTRHPDLPLHARLPDSAIREGMVPNPPGSPPLQVGLARALTRPAGAWICLGSSPHQ